MRIALQGVVRLARAHGCRSTKAVLGAQNSVQLLALAFRFSFQWLMSFFMLIASVTHVFTPGLELEPKHISILYITFTLVTTPSFRTSKQLPSPWVSNFSESEAVFLSQSCYGSCSFGVRSRYNIMILELAAILSSFNFMKSSNICVLAVLLFSLELAIL